MYPCGLWRRTVLAEKIGAYYSENGENREKRGELKQTTIMFRPINRHQKGLIKSEKEKEKKRTAAKWTLRGTETDLLLLALFCPLPALFSIFRCLFQ